MARSKFPMSAEAAHHRARIAGMSASYSPDDPVMVDARRSLAAARIADFIKKTVATAPPLSAEQRDRLAELLRPARQRKGGAA